MPLITSKSMKRVRHKLKKQENKNKKARKQGSHVFMVALTQSCLVYFWTSADKNTVKIDQWCSTGTLHSILVTYFAKKGRGNSMRSWGKTDLELSVTIDTSLIVSVSFSLFPLEHIHTEEHMVSSTSDESLLSLLCFSVDLIHTLWGSQTDNKANLFQALKNIWFISVPVVVKVDLRN